MKKKTLVMVMASFCTSPLYAAAFDRTGQSISAFLQPGNYFEASLSVSDTSLGIGLHRRGVERVNCGPKLLDLGEKGVYSSYTLSAAGQKGIRPCPSR